jgi:allene oxide cyclase-like protein
MISSPAHLTSARRRYRTRVAVAVTAAACLVAVVSAAAGAPDKHPGRVVRTITVYAFQEGSLIPVAGTNPNVLAQGDEEVVNDQLTATHAGKSGFPIIGHDAGTCTFTRVIDPHEGLANCVATAALPDGSLTAQGIVTIDAGESRPSDLAITGGTGDYQDAQGTVHVADTTGHEILTIKLQALLAR